MKAETLQKANLNEISRQLHECSKQEFLAMSLPYGLFGVIKNTVCKVISMHEYTLSTRPSVHGFTYCDFDKFKPILRPLSDITKPIEHKGRKFVPLCRLLENNNFDLTRMSEEYIMSFEDIFMTPDLISLRDLPLYLELHFDIAGLIEKGEAIDVNTLPENPYK